jgi:thymidylate synthase
MADLSIEAIQNDSSKEPNLGLAGAYLMFQAESLHQTRLQDLEDKQLVLNNKLSALKNHLKECYTHLKSDSKQPLNLSEIKESILKLWNEWREAVKEKDPAEYATLKTDLERLDFSNLTAENIEKTLISELENIQRHYEFKYSQIPNQLRLFIELFTILVEILKEFPKKFAEVNSHINRNIGKG